MYEKVAQTINDFGLLTPEEPIVVGVSGGADSLCLLDCLVELGYALVVAHLDHQLRPESGEEAQFVEKICESYGVPCIQQATDVRKLAGEGGSLEEAARLARYNFLARIAREQNSKYVAVGHTCDDQVETILMHLLRGSGPGGLRGMLPKTSFTQWAGIEIEGEIDLVRPLLECSRIETVAHCQHLGLTPVDDPSNADLTLHRNRIRHELLPLLESYNPGIREVILRLSDVMREQVAFNQMQLTRVWPEVMTALGSKGYVINVRRFRELHPFLQGSIIRHAIANLAPALRDISYEATIRAKDWLEGSRGSLTLPGELSLEWFGENALICRPGEFLQFETYPQLSSDSELILRCPGEIELDNGWHISAQVESRQDPSREPWTAGVDHMSAVFCAKGFPPELTVRRRRSGDRIQLPAVDGTTKIADLMINRKIPRQLRAQWPLIVSGDQMLWVPGVHRSDQYMITEDSSDIVVLQLQPPEEFKHV